MVQQNKEYKNYDLEGLETLATSERPIAGQSLTNNPEQKLPWEGPVQFNELQPAMEAIFLEITEDDVYLSIINLVKNNLPIGDIAQVILYDGFTKGMWNPDLMLLLVEPIMYMVLALAEQAGIKNPTIYNGEKEEPSSQQEQLKSLEQTIDVMKEKLVPKIKKGVIPPSIAEKVEAFVPPKAPSLLEADEEQTEEMPRESLLDKEI